MALAFLPMLGSQLCTQRHVTSRFTRIPVFSTRAAFLPSSAIPMPHLLPHPFPFRYMFSFMPRLFCLVSTRALPASSSRCPLSAVRASTVLAHMTDFFFFCEIGIRARWAYRLMIVVTLRAAHHLSFAFVPPSATACIPLPIPTCMLERVA